MTYRLKNQKNALGTFVLYDREWIPQKCYPENGEREVVFYTDLERAAFLTKMMIPGFGGAYLMADNLGEGYCADGELIDFYYEAARCRLHSLKGLAKELKREFGFIPVKAEKRLDKAEGILEAEPGKADTSLEALCEMLWAGEELIEFRSRNIISKRGIRRDFLLGCSTKGFTDSSDEWKMLFSDLFNCVCIPTHWGVLEPEMGERHYDVIRDMVQWSKEQGMNIRGHAVVWFCGLWEAQNWMGELSYEEIKVLVSERVRFLMSEFGKDFDYIDFNEPMQSDGLNMTFDEHFAIVKEAYQIVKQYNPECKVMINFFDEWQELFGIDREKMMKKHYQTIGYRSPEYEWSVSVYQYIDRCLAEGMQIECLGLQWHDFPYDLYSSYELIKHWYNRYHLPLQITELEVASGTGQPAHTIGVRPNPAPDLYWHEPWSEAIQAEWLEKYLLLCYSMEEVEAFCVFGFCEAPTQWGNYVNGKGVEELFRVSACAYSCLLDEQYHPKPSYYTLKRLAKELGINKEYNRK